MKSKKIRDSARFEDCTVRLMGCQNDIETTVAAHINEKGHGATGAKCSDLFIAYACHHCHDLIDGRKKSSLPRIEIRLAALEGMRQTQRKLKEKGLISICE